MACALCLNCARDGSVSRSLRAGGEAAVSSRADAKEIEWLTYREALEILEQANPPLAMIYFSHRDCKPCDLLEKWSFTDPRVVRAAKDMVAVKIQGDVETQIAQRLNINTYPMIVFARLDNGEIDRKAGYRDAGSLAEWIENVLAGRGTIAKLRKELESNPDDPELLLRQARNYLDADDPPASLQLIEKASALDAENAAVLVVRGLYHLRVGKLDEAEKVIAAALELDEQNEEARRLHIMILLGKTETLLEQQEYAVAKQQYLQILELDGSNFAAHMGLGQAYRKSGEGEKALEEFRKAAVIRPDSAVPHVALGDLYQEQKDDQTAEQEYLTAIVMEPRYEPPYFRLMELYERNGQRDELMDIFAKAYPVEPAGAHNEIAWLFATSKCPEIFDPIAAEKHAQAAVELEPDPMYIDTLAEAYYAQGEYKLAIGVIKEAIAADSEDLAYYREQLEKFEKAKDGVSASPE